MNRLTAAAAVLLLHGPARADMGPPWPTYRVPVRVTITADPPPPGVEVFIESLGLRRMPAGAPLVLQSDIAQGGVGFALYAVPTTALKQFDGAVPPRDWFLHPNRDYRVIGSAKARGSLDYFDGRSEVVQEYRLEWHGEGGQLVKVYDNEGSRRWYTWPCCGATVAIPVGVLWFVGWMLGRAVSRRAQQQAAKGVAPPLPDPGRSDGDS